MTDHCPTFLNLKILLNGTDHLRNNDKIKIVTRSHSEEDNLKFERLVCEFNWGIIENDDVNLYAENFVNAMNDIYCKSFPVKIKYISKKRLNKPWLTPPILKLIKAKSDFFKLHKLGLVTDQENKVYKNKVNSMIKRAKTDYYKISFLKHKNNIKKTWKLIKSLISCGIKSANTKSLITNGIEYSGDSTLANMFNNFFSNIATQLDGNLPTNNIDPLKYIKANYCSSLYLNPVTAKECGEVIEGLNMTLYDKNTMSVRTLKGHKNTISPILAKLINKCFSAAVFPDILKFAIITPILKKDDKRYVDNYRPVSILPLISKVFETCLKTRLLGFSDRFSLISPNQFGFQKGKSTEDALLLFTSYLYDSMDQGEHNINIFVDFRKAFDTVNHSILLSKLELYGIRGHPLNLLRSYLLNRKQSVRFNNTYSDVSTINIGIPQGSILGPLLFLFYINDLPNVSNKLHTILFADDTTFSFRDSSYFQLINTCNRELELFKSWTIANRLSLNVEKTFSILITNRINDVNESQLSIGGQHIKRVGFCKFLGIIIDDKLNFKEQIRQVSLKLSKAIGILYKLQHYVPKNTMINLYYTFVYPYLIYCNTIWYSTYPTHLKPIITLQKRIIRIINSVSFFAHTNELFRENKILKTTDLHKYNLCVHLFKTKKYNNFTRSHTYDTRNRSDLQPSFHRLSSTQNSFSFSAPTAWNNLPQYVKLATSLDMFKALLKSHLLSNY